MDTEFPLDLNEKISLILGGKLVRFVIIVTFLFLLKKGRERTYPPCFFENYIQFPWTAVMSIGMIWLIWTDLMREKTS